MTNHIPITPDLTKHFIAKKNGNIESHAKIKLFCRHRSEVKKKKKYTIYLRCLEHMKNLYEA